MINELFRTVQAQTRQHRVKPPTRRSKIMDGALKNNSNKFDR